jgi:hypothetical protein
MRPALLAALAAFTVATLGCDHRKAESAGEDSAPVAATEAAANTSSPSRSGVRLALSAPIAEGVRVDVYEHTISAKAGPVPAWTYVSHGLAELGHEEIVLTVKRAADEAEPPTEPLGYYADVHRFARQKQIVTAGGRTIFGRDGFVHPQARAVVYVRGIPLDGVPTPRSFLTGIVLTRGEIELAEREGQLRVLAHLGDSQRWFPTTPWLDRERPELPVVAASAAALTRPVSVAAIAAQSFVPRMRTRGNISGGSVVLERSDGQTRVILTLPRSDRAGLAQALSASDLALALTLGLNPGADAIFVWAPGIRSHERAIVAGAAPGRRISGNFVIFSKGTGEDTVKPMEDGFTVGMTPATSAKLAAAVAAGRSFEVSSPSLSLLVAWTDR